VAAIVAVDRGVVVAPDKGVGVAAAVLVGEGGVVVGVDVASGPVVAVGAEIESVPQAERKMKTVVAITDQALLPGRIDAS
jgi:hypothetical protein